MLCPLCNDQERTASELSLRLDTRAGDQREVTVPLCDDCATELLAEDWIERRELVADDD